MPKNDQTYFFISLFFKSHHGVKEENKGEGKKKGISRMEIALIGTAIVGLLGLIGFLAYLAKTNRTKK